MKQYLNSDQTAKLIEMGFKPPMWRVARKFDDQPPRKIITSFGELRTASYEDVYAYSIGELIDMLPNVVESEDSEYATLQMYFDLFNWIIEYTGVEKTEYATSAIELIDALYDMIIKLKEEGIWND